MGRSPISSTLDSTLIAELTAVGGSLAQRGWLPATGGNLSGRTSKVSAAITASGRDKGSLRPDDFIQVTWTEHDATFAAAGPHASAESALHVAIFRADPSARAVLHTHSPESTVLSRVVKSDTHAVSGYEMQKALRGHSDHLETISISIFDNDQDMPALAGRVTERWSEVHPCHAFLVRGHGLYAWGRSTAEALRHVETWEFLIRCELLQRQR